LLAQTFFKDPPVGGEDIVDVGNEFRESWFSSILFRFFLPVVIISAASIVAEFFVAATDFDGLSAVQASFFFHGLNV